MNVMTIIGIVLAGLFMVVLVMVLPLMGSDEKDAREAIRSVRKEINEEFDKTREVIREWGEQRRRYFENLEEYYGWY